MLRIPIWWYAVLGRSFRVFSKHNVFSRKQNLFASLFFRTESQRLLFERNVLLDFTRGVGGLMSRNHATNCQLKRNLEIVQAWFSLRVWFCWPRTAPLRWGNGSTSCFQFESVCYTTGGGLWNCKTNFTILEFSSRLRPLTVKYARYYLDVRWPRS